MINRLCIVGVGLIGGSLARALKSAGACKEIIGFSRESANLEKARQLNVIDCFDSSLAVAVKNADVVVISVPVGAVDAVFKSLAECVSENTIITDVGSTKGSVLSSAEKYLGPLVKNFVPAHPIAGTEKSGVEVSTATLFTGRRVIITPTDSTNENAISFVQSMWQATGAEVVIMDVEQHDDVLAATSHLPHLLAYSLVDTLSQLDKKNEIFKYAAGGFRDFTRIASSDPTMWHDICLSNSTAILDVLETFSTDLKKLEQAIKNKDSEFIMNVFARAKESRDAFCNE